MRPFKKGATGGQDGYRIKVIERKNWGSTYVYKLRIFARAPARGWWIEYQEHSRLVRDQCFRWRDDGEYDGKHRELRCKEF